MARVSLLLSLMVCVCLTRGLAAADTKAEPKLAHANLSAEQVIEKHVAARGGSQAWHAVQTLAVSGKMDAGYGDSVARSRRLAEGGVGASIKKQERAEAAAGPAKDKPDQQVQLPFKLEMKRPHKSRLEIEFAGKTAVQVYDGVNGWKLRPYLNRNDAEPFTAEEAKFESTKADLEGPLVDYAAKGTKVELAGVDTVAGHAAYKLKLTTKSGEVQHIWIDAQSFLDVKVEGIQRRMDGRMRNVWLYQRDFRSVQGVMVPFVVETVVEGFPQSHKMTIESVAVNRVLDDSRFTKPQVLVAQMPAASAATAPVKQ
jgi:hypothetical protein